MRIVSWNVNGLRTLDHGEKSSLKDTFDGLNADIIAIQETKIAANDPRLGRLARLSGYDAFFSFCRTRDGYSGVATYCKQDSEVCVTPIDAGEGFTNAVGGAQASFFDTGLTPVLLDQMEREGRCVITDHEQFVLINVYVPAVTVEDRAPFKYKFCVALQRKVEALQKAGRNVCVVGDLNISHQRIDKAKKLSLDMDMKSPTRLWLNRMLTNGGMVDTFRHFKPKQEDAFTCWNTQTNARQTNYGVRIDYVLANRDFVSKEGLSAEVLQDVYGSDHCPVAASFKNDSFLFKGRREPPAFCTKFLPHLASRQSSIKDFLNKPRSDSPVKAGASVPITLNESASQSRQTQFTRGRNSKSGSRTGKPKPKSQSSIKSFFTPLTPEKRRASQDFDIVSNDTSGKLPASEPGYDDISAKPNDLNVQRAKRWKNILKGPPEAPWCKVHKLKCATKVVTKKSENKGRKFFSCPRPECNTFYWYSELVERRRKEERARDQLSARVG